MEHTTTQKIIGAAIEVHRRLGPGLLEATYEMCFAHELKYRNIPFERQQPYPLIYRDIVLEAAYRIDFLVENSVVVEIKSVESLLNVHTAQLLTYLRLLNLRKGLLLNFNVPLLKDGIKRLSNEKITNDHFDAEISASSALSAPLR
jgi:GxxExxY protein